jgi:molecular chaperone GrpE (heat shock protein)
MSVNNMQINRSAIYQPTIRWSSTDSKEPKVEEKDPAVAEPAVDDFGDVIPPVVDETVDIILALEKEVRDLKDRVIRSLAEEENVRERIVLSAVATRLGIGSELLYAYCAH